MEKMEGLRMFDISFYKGKTVFITGHTGFKGSWLCKTLANAGAVVTGYSLNHQQILHYLKLQKLKTIFTRL